MEQDRSHSRVPLLSLVAAAALTGTAAYVVNRMRSGEPHPPDSAPGRTARQGRFGDYRVQSRTVTIGKPRREIYDFWRDFSNLPKFMDNVKSVTTRGDKTHWTITGPAGSDVEVITRLVEDRPGEEMSWQSTEDSQIETRGKVAFRDAPGKRGTEVTAIIAYQPPGGLAGHIGAKLTRSDPETEGRHELKRLKMLLETGEIATNHNQKSA
jgi:uncharacterized membrane protein